MLLEPAGSLEPFNPDITQSYDPFFLDNPELKAGRHRTVITLPCFLGTIIQPHSELQLKKELNGYFRETHPGVDASLSLTQIRNLKLMLCKLGFQLDLEISSIAVAIVYLEKLILKNFVQKTNKKLIGVICLLLAAKVNDPKETTYTNIIQAAATEFELLPKDIYAQEFSTYAALEFNLFLPPWEVKPHLDRIRTMNSTTNISSEEVD
ncbi:hypothetical protein BC833DRAFT_561905 [Globomyces pollinis-pini]|nr:hypothetical protein BC833DRAFT_561905 [Globomyces pollinis-pini]